MDASIIERARAAGVSGQSWMDWTASDEVQALVDAPNGICSTDDTHALKVAFQDGAREHFLSRGWRVVWTTAPESYDTFGTDTVETVIAEGRDWHGKTLRCVIIDPQHYPYQTDRYRSGLHPTWGEDPRVEEARSKARLEQDRVEREAQEAKRVAGLEWLKVAADAEVEACLEDDAAHDHMVARGLTSADIRAEQARRVAVVADRARAAEWERCLAFVKEGSTILDLGTPDVRSTYGFIRGRPMHVYYNIRIVRGWPDDAEHANVIGDGNDNAGSVLPVAEHLKQGTRMRVLSPDAVPPRPVVERIGHERVAEIRRHEIEGRVVWSGRPRFGLFLILDEKGHLVRSKKVLAALGQF